MTNGEDKQRQGEKSGFSMKHVGEDLESIAGEVDAMRRGVEKASEALRNTQEAEDPSNTEPMQMWTHDSGIGGTYPLSPESMYIGSSFYITQRTDICAEALPIIGERLEVEAEKELKPGLGGAAYRFKYVEDPHSHTRFEIVATYGMDTSSGVHESSHKHEAKSGLSLEGVEFHTLLTKAVKDEVADDPYKIDVREGGYSAYFPAANFRLDLNDPRNPRNWGPARVKKYIDDKLMPLVDLPALKDDGRGHLERRVDENETPAQRSEHIAHAVKEKVEDYLYDLARAKQLLNQNESMLRQLIEDNAAELKDYIQQLPDGTLDLDRTINMLSTPQDTAESQDASSQGQLIKARTVAAAIVNSRRRVEFLGRITNETITHAENIYDAGFTP